MSKEDGASASEWYISLTGSGISVSSVADTARRSDVIKCQNNSEAKPVYRIGEKGGTSENPNDSAWDSTKRVLSFWMKGECSAMNVQVSASTGEKYVQYLFGTGSSGALSGGNAKVYLGYPASEDWVRFERNVEADFEAYAGGGATWTNTDGLYIHWPKDLLSCAFYMDDIRLSNSLTVEHNTLGPGVIGHILRHTTWDSGTLAKTDRWFHYDQVGSVMSETDDGGTLEVVHHQDAFGNVQEAWASGLWDAGAEGWRGFTKNLGTSEGYYFFRRWYLASISAFSSQAPMPHSLEVRYGFARSNPSSNIDPAGRYPFVYGNWCGGGRPETGTQPPVVDAIDNCCRTHDLCYDRYGIEAGDPSSGHKKECDGDFCACIQRTKGEIPIDAIYARVFSYYIICVFCW